MQELEDLISLGVNVVLPIFFTVSKIICMNNAFYWLQVKSDFYKIRRYVEQSCRQLSEAKFRAGKKAVLAGKEVTSRLNVEDCMGMLFDSARGAAVAMSPPDEDIEFVTYLSVVVAAHMINTCSSLSQSADLQPDLEYEMVHTMEACAGVLKTIIFLDEMIALQMAIVYQLILIFIL
ncbi:uncharacterized protein LOC106663727 [Cimex lectularius]|uniref:Uncharacterized protein n=1 Tax=Cimex lectularius TaxID=79782 RepID=A0A8I6RI21_CIMLE|nr:uncharacterized protein LOC106663727 [Cimex lectularius]